MVGPIILIGVGIVALLILTGHINSGEFWAWYGHWWPLLLIGAGLAMLGEWALDMKRQTPVRRGGNFVGILIFLAVLGCSPLGDTSGGGPCAPSGAITAMTSSTCSAGRNTIMDQQVLNTQIPPNATIEIQNPRGDVSITAGDSATMRGAAHAVAYAE